jgi:hypothetical protein
MNNRHQHLPFFTRLAMAFVCFFRILFNPVFASRVHPVYLHPGALPEGAGGPTPAEKVMEAQRAALEAQRAADRERRATVAVAKAAEQPPEQVHASSLFLLSMLQREGRLIDFLQEEVASFSDAEVGAAARVVHEGCRKVVRQYLSLEPVVKDTEGASVSVPLGFDAQRIRLTGNVAGHPPFTGALRHHGWATSVVRLPAVPTAIDPKILAPAEVELS